MVDQEPSPFPWGGMNHEFELADARIVATVGATGGAIVENVRRLLCSEGRLFAFETTEQGRVLQLEYSFKFATSDEAEPYASQAVEARIIISGTHANGLRLEIRGNGWIGYDEAGKVEGNFDHPPVLIPEDDEPDDETARPRASRRFGWQMPPQFIQANTRVPTNDEWSDLD